MLKIFIFELFLIFICFTFANSVLVHRGTWVSGTSNLYDPGNITINYLNPSSRYGQISYHDTITSKLYIFGGIGLGLPSSIYGFFNDMWEYDLITSKWLYINGQINIIDNLGNSTYPAARAAATTWVNPYDSTSFYMFGGVSYIPDTSYYRFYNQLWEYNIITQNWNLLSGSIQGNDTNDISGSKIGSRYYHYNWFDSNTNDIYVFGGKNHIGYHNDLWKLNTYNNEWSYIGERSLANYGYIGQSSIINWPGKRYSGISWLNPINKKFYLFGGFGSDIDNDYGDLADLWCYDPLLSIWTWLGGPSLADQPGTYGIKGIPNSGPGITWPGCRKSSMGWSDSITGDLWIYGGIEYYYPTSIYHDDIWHYSMQTGEFIWMGGTSVTTTGNYGIKNIKSINNWPGPRSQGTFLSSQEVTECHFNLFGGFGVDINDINLKGGKNDFWNLEFGCDFQTLNSIPNTDSENDCSDVTLGEICTLDCLSGSYGGVQATCLEYTGEWNIIQGSCDRDCGSSLSSNTIDISDCLLHTWSNDSCQASCLPMVVGENASVTCLPSGSWAIDSDCSPILCGNLPDIINNNYIIESCQSNIYNQQICPLSCLPGYIAINNTMIDMYAICNTSTSNWTTIINECYSIPCSINTLQEIFPNAILSCDYKAYSNISSGCIFYCDSSELQTITAKCLTTGYWELSEDTCNQSIWLAWSNTSLSISTVFSLITIISIGIFIFLLSYYRKKKQLTVSSPLFLFLILSGAICLIIINIIHIFPNENESRCYIIPILTTFGFDLVFGSVFFKTWRLYRIFYNSGLTERVITNTVLLKRMSLLLFCELSVLTLSLIFNAPTLHVKDIDSNNINYRIPICEYPSFFYFIFPFVIIKTVLLVGSCYLVYRTRRIPSMFNESRWIALAVYNLVLFVTFFAFIHLAISDNYFLLFIFDQVWIAVVTISTLCMLFLPKFYSIAKGEDPKLSAFYPTGVTRRSTSTTPGIGTKHTGRHAAAAMALDYVSRQASSKKWQPHSDTHSVLSVETEVLDPIKESGIHYNVITTKQEQEIDEEKSQFFPPLNLFHKQSVFE